MIDNHDKVSQINLDNYQHIPYKKNNDRTKQVFCAFKRKQD